VCIHNPSKETGKLVCIIVEPKIVTSILSNCSAAVELLAKKIIQGYLTTDVVTCQQRLG